MAQRALDDLADVVGREGADEPLLHRHDAPELVGRDRQASLGRLLLVKGGVDDDRVAKTDERALDREVLDVEGVVRLRQPEPQCRDRCVGEGRDPGRSWRRR